MSKHLPVMDSRRGLLRQGAFLGAAALLVPAAFLGCAVPEKPQPVPATEELMREHGLVRRLLAVWEEMARRLKCCQDVSAAIWRQALALNREFVQEHHEKLEEELLFPRFEKSGQLVALVKILRGQHAAGRKIGESLAQQSQPGAGRNFVQRAQMEAYLNMFIRMYRVHAAREDTVLFPAVRTLLTPAEFADLGKQLADREQARSSPEAETPVLGQITELEKALGLSDLEEFTPKL